MKKFEKEIARNSKYVDSQISKFTSAIDETERAIELHNGTVARLKAEREEIDRLIEVTENEKERAEKFLDSITSLIK